MTASMILCCCLPGKKKLVVESEALVIFMHDAAALASSPQPGGTLVHLSHSRGCEERFLLLDVKSVWQSELLRHSEVLQRANSLKHDWIIKSES